MGRQGKREGSKHLPGIIFISVKPQSVFHLKAPTTMMTTTPSLLPYTARFSTESRCSKCRITTPLQRHTQPVHNHRQEESHKGK